MCINKTIDHIDEHFVKTDKETFFAWHMHSDNAPSHFKSSQTMNYLTKLPTPTRLAHHWAEGSGETFRVFWEFGAPGHGKGVLDGIGVWIKRTVRQDITDHRPPKIGVCSPRLVINCHQNRSQIIWMRGFTQMSSSSSTSNQPSTRL